jgi:signal transduction histidine kinase
VFHSDQSLGPASPLIAPAPPQQRHLTSHQSEMAEHEQRQEQLRETNEQLVLSALGAQELLAAAEDTQRRQAKLLSLFANELNNPLAPIRLAAAALGQPGAEKTLLPRVQAIIEKQVDKMSRLVSELLDPRQVSQAQLQLGRQTFDVAASIDAAVEACRPTMDRRQQTLEVTISRPLEMSGDPALPRQVLMSLLTYASLYTDNGGSIQVGAKVVDDKLLLTVIDSGQGILQDAASSAFDPFVIDPRAGLVDGDGISTRLAAMCEIVEVHGGTVVATNVDDRQGSQFTVSLPMEPVSVSDGHGTS